MSKQPDVTNVKVVIDDLATKRACLSFDAEGAHWHYWLNAHHQAECGVGRSTPTLYKRREGKHTPQRLDLLKDGKLRPIADAAFTLAIGHGLFIAAEQRARRKNEARLACAAGENRIARQKAAGPMMFEALAAIEPLIADWASDPTKNWAHRQVVNALAAAREGTAGVAHNL